MKDIFIDTNVVKNFTNPLDPEYKKLISWLKEYNPFNLANNAVLVVSKKLLGEYYRSARFAHTDTSIPVIIDQLTREGRRNLITNMQIYSFKNQNFTKSIKRKLRSNKKDWNYIPLVLLSYRKYALSIDDNFIYDIKHFPGFQVKAAKRPEAIPYK